MADRGPGLEAEAIVLIVLSTLALVVRFWSRAITDNYYWWDDWLALATFPCFLGLATCFLIWKDYAGLGKHASAVTPDQTIHGFQLLFAGFWLYNFALTLPKFSVLFFYARVFKPYQSRWLKFGSYLTGTLAVVRLLDGIVSSLIQCRPIAKTWDHSIPGTCVNRNRSFIVSGVLDAFPDLIIVILPLPIIWKLQSTLSKKVAMSMLFICGYSVFAIPIVLVVISAVQGATLFEDFSWNVVPRVTIILLEPAVSLISICLPALLLLIKRARTQGLAGLFVRRAHADEESNLYGTDSGPFSSGSRVGRFERVHIDSAARTHVNTRVTAPKTDPESNSTAVDEKT